MPKEIHGAGVMPIAFHGEDFYFLLGQERYDKGWRDSNKYSSFGGKREKGESILDAAVREGYEEGMGFLGTEADLRKQLKRGASKFIGTVEEYAHRTYLYEIDYDTDMPKKFKDVYQYALKCGRKELDRVCPHGLWEKKAMKWFSSRELARLAYTDWKTDGQKMLRWTFAMTVGQMISIIRKYQRSKGMLSEPKKKVVKRKKTSQKPKRTSRKTPKRKKTSRKTKKRKKTSRKPKRKTKRKTKKRRKTSRKTKKQSRKKR